MTELLDIYDITLKSGGTTALVNIMCLTIAILALVALLKQRL